MSKKIVNASRSDLTKSLLPSKEIVNKDEIAFETAYRKLKRKGKDIHTYWLAHTFWQAALEYYTNLRAFGYATGFNEGRNTTRAEIYRLMDDLEKTLPYGYGMHITLEKLKHKLKEAKL